MSAVRRIGTWITRHWVTTVCIVLLCAATAAGLVTAAGGYSVDDNPANAVFATGQHQVIELGRWWTISTWTLMGSSIEELLFAVALVLLAGWLVEHRVRRAPWVLGSLVALVIGALLAILLESAGIDADFPGAYEAAQKLVSDPSALGATLAAVGSAWCPRVMRRRIRSSLAMLTTMLVVYVGHPSDLQRLLAVLVGILIGSALVREPLVHDLWRPSRSHELRAWLASMLAVLGVGPIIASVAMRANAVAVPLVSLFMSDAQFDADACNVWHVSEACASLSAHSGFTMFLDNVITGLPWLVLVLAAWGVWRGQRIPLWIGVTIVGALGLTVWYFWLIEPLVLGDLDLTTAPLWGQQGQWFWQVLIIGLVHLVVAGVLIANQRLCQNQPDVRLVRKSLRGVGLGLLALAALYLGVAWSFPVTFTPTPDPWQAVLHLPERFLPQNLVALSPSSLQPVDELSSLLCVAIPILTTLIMLVALWRIMTAPEHHREEPSLEDRANALKQGSVSTLSAMTQWPGMHSWLDRDTGTLVPFRLERGVAIILAAPLGTSDADISARAVLAFADYADARGWIPALYSAPESLTKALREHGWASVEVGEEAVILLAEWSTKGKPRQDIRTSMNRAAREGLEVKWCTFDELTVAEAKHIRALSEAWVGEKPLPEMGFTLGGFRELDDPDTVIGMAVSKDGDILAVTSWMPVWRDGVVVGRILDFMRRTPNSMNGVMEMLIGSAANRFQEDGLEEISLSAAPLATSASTGAQSTAEAGEHALLDRLLEELSKRMEPLYGFRSLLSFKRKFKPEYRPLYLAYPDAVELPAIGFGLTNAYLPELTLSQSWQAVRMIRSSERERARREAERRREQHAAAKRERAAAAAAEQSAVAETAPAEARNAAADQGESAQAAHPERKSQGS